MRIHAFDRPQIAEHLGGRIVFETDFQGHWRLDRVRLEIVQARQRRLDSSGDSFARHLRSERLRSVKAQVLLDRKSTRLNSSHGYISYAVFCLKKKKKDVVTTVRRSRDLLCQPGLSPRLQSTRRMLLSDQVFITTRSGVREYVSRSSTMLST